MSSARQYRAFISYSHRDVRVAKGLQRHLEGLKLPAKMRAGAHPQSADDTDVASHPLRPIFRDRTEFSAAASLGQEIEAALEASDFLIVIASQNAATSQWVGKEIDHFYSLGRGDRILIYIAESEAEGSELVQLLPANNWRASQPDFDPLAADARRFGDGTTAARLKIAARMLDVPYDELAQRHLRQRNRRLTAIAGAALVVAGITATLSVTVFLQSRIVTEQRNIAQEERDSAQATVDYIVDLFRVSASRQVNPEDVSALLLLQEGVQQLRQRTLPDRVRRQLALTMGESLNNLGAFEDATGLLEASVSSTRVKDDRGVELRLLLAEANIGMGQLEAAESNLKPLATAEVENEMSTLQRLALLQAQASLAYFSADDAQAVKYYTEAMSLTEDPELTARISGNLATVHRQLNELEQATELYSQAADTYKALGNNPVNLANAYIGLAETQAFMGQAEQALPAIEEALGILDPVLPKVHPKRAIAALTRGSVFNTLSQYQKALADFADAEQQVESLYGRNHMLMSEVIAGLAESHLGMQQ
ncbi:MAG: toll/interleukin-1 receptor domain-containing protein, partial [Pseudomonadota bacterium]